MSLQIYTTPPAVVFTGNPVIFGVKDTGLLSVNSEQHGIYNIYFTQGIVNAYAIEITHGDNEYFFQSVGSAYFASYYKAILPLKIGGETLAAWVARLAAALRGDISLNSTLYCEETGQYITLIEKALLGDITMVVNVYMLDPDGSDYCTHGEVEASQSVAYGSFHAIGIKPELHITTNYITPGGTISSVPSDYGEGIEVVSSVYYTDESEPFTRETDGSLCVDADVHELIKFSAKGHFDISLASLVRDLAWKFSMYFYVVSGNPKVRGSGLRSSAFMVIDAEITKQMQARLNASDTSMWQYLIDTKMAMTWSPDDKVLDVYQPERLYHILKATVVNAVIKCKEYFSDDTTATNTLVTFSAVQYQVIEFSAAFQDVRSNSGKTVLKYEIWIEDSGAAVLMAVRTYIMSYIYQPYARYWMLKNGFGVYECIRTTGPAVKIAKIEKEYIEKELPLNFTPTDREREQVSQVTGLSLSCFTGPLNAIWARYILELFDSEDAYLLQQGNAIPADIDGNDYDFGADGENINNLEFEAILTSIDEEILDSSIVLPIDGEYTKDFDEGFLIGT